MSDGVEFTLLERDGKVKKYKVIGTDIFLTSNIIFERQVPGPNTYGASVAIQARRTKGACKEITVKRTYVNDELPLEIPLDHEIFVTP